MRNSKRSVAAARPLQPQYRYIAVCLEIAKGPLVYALQRYAFLVLFLVNPSTLAKFRKTFCVSGAKTIPVTRARRD